MNTYDVFRRHLRQDMTVCTKCFNQITDGNITPYCEQCGEQNVFLNAAKFQQIYGVTPEYYSSTCNNDNNHHGLLVNTNEVNIWAGLYCPYCGEQIQKPDS